VLWELALFSVLVPSVYWGVVHVRKRPFGSVTYGAMLIVTAAIAGIAILGRRADAGWADPLAVVALGAGIVQLVLTPLIRAAARWAVATDRLRLAMVLVDLRDLLQPGTGGRDEKRTIAALRDVKAGRVDAAVAALRAMRDHSSHRPDAQAAVDERIVLLLLSAQRWQEAVDAAAPLLAGGDDRPGVSPPLAVELVVARLRVGDLDGAADLAERVLAAGRSAPELVLVVYRLHLVFLAFLGRVADVDRLLAPDQSTYVTASARRYWAAIARQHAGDLDGARAGLVQARTLARGDRRARSLIDAALAELDHPRAAPAPSDRVRALADRMAASQIVVPPRAPPRRAVVTTGLVAANLVVAAICAVVLGGPGDLGSIVRVGANVRGAVDAGEVWRLASATFVHVGLVHLVVNVVALWSLGRLVEGLFGSTRMLAIYGVAGIAGAAASHAMSAAGVSAGASGAIFGLLGAALVELALHRNRYRRQWRRSLLGALAVVTVAQLAIGLVWPMIDQWAHVGGLIGGAVVGALLSPGWQWAEHPVVVWSGRALAAAALAAFAWGGAGAATTTYGDTLRREPRAWRDVGGVSVEVPARWQITESEAGDPDLYVIVELARIEPEGTSVGERLTAWEEQSARAARDRGFTDVAPADGARIRLPDGWRGSEWIVSTRDALGSTQRYRMIVFAGDPGGASIVGTVLVPDVLAAPAAAELGAILATVRP
jgi:membrane associated rhomboid family serine protease